jgi:predicted Zn finger-like uncharacterized protein
MSIATQCPHCGKAYQVAESSVGKQVKCQACGKAFVVQAIAVRPATRAAAVPAGAARAAAKPGVGTGSSHAGAANSGASAERARVAKLEAAMGLQPLPPNANKVFPETPFQRPKNSPSPLANHVVDDPGFEQLSEAELTAQRQAEAAAREAEALTYGKDDDDLTPKPPREKTKAEQFALSLAGVLLLYAVANFIMYNATNGETLLMPKAVARILNLAK